MGDVAVQEQVVTGSDLRRERETANISKLRLARAWPCSRTNVQLIEGAAFVTPERAGRFRDALARAQAAGARAVVDEELKPIISRLGRLEDVP